MSSAPARVILACSLVLLLYWMTRIPALQALPLHNDEGLHLTRAVEVWNLHPFWEIRDGKIVNHFAIAVFYPQNAPVFVGRIATLFVSAIGLAAGFRLALRRFGAIPAFGAVLFWLTSPYLLFYERLALSDAEAGALVVLSLWAADRLVRSGRARDALLTGVCFGTAALFKFTAIPFALAIVIFVLVESRAALTRKVQLLCIVGATTAALFVVPVAYLLLRGSDLFSIALGWIGGGAGGPIGSTFFLNIERAWQALSGFMPLSVFVLVLALAAAWLDRRARPLLMALLLPMLTIFFLGREVLPRHIVVGLPLALVLAGVGFRVVYTWERRGGGLAIGIFLLLVQSAITPFSLQYAAQGDQIMPDIERQQFVTDHSAGYGLREAVRAFPRTVPSGAPIIGSMFPDGCRRANFYADEGWEMVCTDAPGTDAMQAALETSENVYVLTDSAPLIGVDIVQAAADLNANATRLTDYLRPGEYASSASVVLWRLTRN